MKIMFDSMLNNLYEYVLLCFVGKFRFSIGYTNFPIIAPSGVLKAYKVTIPISQQDFEKFYF